MGLITRFRLGFCFNIGWCNIHRLFAISALFLVLTLQGLSHATAQQFKFSALDVQGNLRIESATIRNYADIPISEPVSAAQLNSAYQSIAASGLFEEVELIPRGSRLLIRVKEYPTINKVAFEGQHTIRLLRESTIPLHWRLTDEATTKLNQRDGDDDRVGQHHLKHVEGTALRTLISR